MEVNITLIVKVVGGEGPKIVIIGTVHTFTTVTNLKFLSIVVIN